MDYSANWRICDCLRLHQESETISTIPLAVTVIGVVMVTILLAHYEKMGWGIALIMGPLESIGMLPKVLSYVRLFAVGVVGVKIAATGNEMIYEVMAHTLPDLSHASTTDIILVACHVHRLDAGPDFCPSIGRLQS